MQEPNISRMNKNNGLNNKWPKINGERSKQDLKKRPTQNKLKNSIE